MKWRYSSIFIYFLRFVLFQNAQFHGLGLYPTSEPLLPLTWPASRPCSWPRPWSTWCSSSSFSVSSVTYLQVLPVFEDWWQSSSTGRATTSLTWWWTPTGRGCMWPGPTSSTSWMMHSESDTKWKLVRYYQEQKRLNYLNPNSMHLPNKQKL